MARKKVLIAGVSGLVGHGAAEAFAATGEWDVVGVSRRQPDDLPGIELLPVDLTDSQACGRAFSDMTDVTHVVYAALQEQPGLFAGWLDEGLMQRNSSMLRNLFEPLAAAAHGLEHVCLLHGTKAYGIHHPAAGDAPVHNPLRERDPRREHPNFYFLQEDYLQEKRKGRHWDMTIFRPTVIYGDAPGNNMNPIPAIAAYAVLQRERGEPLHFPGAGDSPTLHEAVDAGLLGRAILWAATSDAARGETFNITNGDVFTWEGVWPAIAETLRMKLGERRPISLAEELPMHDADWATIVEKHHLRAAPKIVDFVGYNSLVYTDMVLGGNRRSSVPFLNSTIKLRQAGFHECLDSEDMFRALFSRLQERHVIPPAP